MRLHWFRHLLALMLGACLLTACQPSVIATAPSPSLPPTPTAHRPPPARTSPTARPRRTPTAITPRQPSATVTAPSLPVPGRMTPVRTLPTAVPVTPTPLPTAAASVWQRDAGEYSLADLSPAAADFLRSREGATGVAVTLPDYGITFTDNGHSLFHLASVAKIFTMLTVLDQADTQRRPVTPYEQSLLEPMIIHSDNDTADMLWQMINGAPGVLDYVNKLSLVNIIIDSEGYWGSSYAAPATMSTLLAKLIQGETLTPTHRTLALNLLHQVDLEYDTWAVTDDMHADMADSYIGHKDGWFCADDGWWVTSVGFVMPDQNGPTYTIAILTNQQPSLEYAVETIETVARLVHFSLKEHSAATPTP